METDFVVQTDNFEGPLDTLLSLIEKRELYINDISLSKVTSDYIQFIADNQETINNKTEFVGIASTLVLAKSKSLLPEQTTEEEQDEIEELEDRLRAYKLMKAKGKELAKQFGSQPLFLSVLSGNSSKDWKHGDMFAPGSNLTVDLLASKAQQSVVSLPDDSLPTAKIEKTVSIKEEIDRLKQCCQQMTSVSFSSAVRSDNKRDHVVLFVAVLELVKAGSLEAEQASLFAEIKLKQA